MPSRRAVLGGAAALGLAGASIGAAATTRVEPPRRGPPAPDSWPLDRFDAANSGANRQATTPDDPAIAWTRAALAQTLDASLLVGPDAVYASDVTYTDSLTAIDRADGAVRWSHGSTGGRLALAGRTVVAAPQEPRPGPDVVAVDAGDGTVRWRATRPRDGADHLVATDRTVFVGGDGAVTARRVDDGASRWRSDGPSKSPTGLAVGDDGLYGTVGERLVRFRPRSHLAVGLRRPPSVGWHTTPIDEAQVPAVAAGSLVVAATVSTDGSERRPALAAHDAATGERQWDTLRSDAVGDPPGHSVLHARHATVLDDVVVAAVTYGGEFRSSADGWPGAHPAPNSVLGCSLADGADRWRQPTQTIVRDVAATGDAVLVGTGQPDGGALLALDPHDGRVRWRRTFDTGVAAVAPVDGAVFAATMDGSVVALR